jgi:hypothetical protein
VESHRFEKMVPQARIQTDSPHIAHPHSAAEDHIGLSRAVDTTAATELAAILELTCRPGVPV